MKSMLRLVILLGTALATTWSAGAQDTVPFEFELPRAAIQLDLFDCRLEVVTETGAQPLIRAVDASGSAGDPAAFRVAQSGGTVQITRLPDPEGAPVTTAVVELVIDSSQSVTVSGSGLSVTMRGEGKPPEEKPPAEGSETAPAGQDAASSTHTLELADSEVALFRTPSTSLRATNTAVHAEGTFGSFSAELAWSTLTVRGHEGSMNLISDDSETLVERLIGNLEFTLTRGGLDLRDGNGNVRGDSREGRVSADHWEGSATVTATDANIEFREGSLAQITFKGVNSDLTVDGVRGNVKADFEGGDGFAESTRGSLDLTGLAGARITGENLQGPLVLRLREDSEAEIRQALDTLTAKVHSSKFFGSGINNLDLVATESAVTLEDVQRTTRFKVDQSHVELDLSQTKEQKFNLKVPDDTYVRVVLYSPCRVRVRTSAEGGKGVDVTGCELQIGTTGRWRGGQLRSIDGRPPFMLIADVGDTGELRVQGGP
jgi:hypothetical protein